MKLELRQIYMPNPNLDNEYISYEKKMQPRMDFDSFELKKLFKLHEEEIMRIVIKEIMEYIEDESCYNDCENMFPCRCRMTGEWYVGDIGLEEENGRIWGSVFTRFLGTYPNSALLSVDDYLGLEVWLEYDQEKNQFIFDHGIDSSVI